MLPLLLNPNGGSGNSAYYLPSDNAGTIYVNSDDLIKLECPGGTVNLGGVSTGSYVAQATCSSGSSFNINGEVVAISEVACSRYPVHVARYTGSSCLGSYKEIEIGFQLSDRFLRHITVCFDEEMQEGVYSKFDLTKTIGGYQSGFPRPNFVEDDFYNVGGNSVDNLYSRGPQRTTINRLIGLAEDDATYIQDTTNFYLARGHLTAKADFIYGSAQRATFHFVNVAPQWQTFNGGNWQLLEGDVTSFASSRGLDLEVYTGTHGVATLPHSVSGEPVALYLYADGAARGIPVPQYFWKVVHDPDTQLGVAFIGVNNPYSNDENDLKLCANICDKIDWLRWKPNDQQQGYAFCCTVDDLRAVVPNVPDFTVSGLLS